MLINQATIEGSYLAIMSEIKAAKRLSKEIIDLGGGEINGNKLLKEDADLHLAEMEAACVDIDCALDKFLATQRTLNNKRRLWIDSKIT